MSGPRIQPTLTVFTKPWKTLPLESLADQVAEWGFHGIELPVRPGFQVEPSTAIDSLPTAQGIFRERGLTIHSIAGEFDENSIRACAAAKVPVLRVMLPIDAGRGYRDSITRFRQKSVEMTPLLLESGVVIGLQNHAGQFVGSAIGLMDTLSPLDPAVLRAVLDLGHTALAGEPEELAIEIASPRLAMINLKNAVYRLTGDHPDGTKTWHRHWTDARSGLTSWSKAVAALRRQFYQGPICLTAEYHGEDGKPLTGDSVIPLIIADVAFLKSLLNETSTP